MHVLLFIIILNLDLSINRVVCYNGIHLQITESYSRLILFRAYYRFKCFKRRSEY